MNATCQCCSPWMAGWWTGRELGWDVTNTRSLLFLSLILLLFIFLFFKFDDVTIVLLLHRNSNVVCWQMTNNQHAPTNLLSIISPLPSLQLWRIVRYSSVTFRLLRDQYFQLFSQTLFHVQSSMKLVLFEFSSSHPPLSSCWIFSVPFDPELVSRSSHFHYQRI